MVPQATPVKKRRVDQYHRLDVMQDGKMWGFVNGKKCCVHLDSGSSDSIMFFSMAKKLGLLTGKEKTETRMLHLWNGS